MHKALINASLGSFSFHSKYTSSSPPLLKQHMVRSVIIARVHDGLPLTASLDEDIVILHNNIPVFTFLF
jgi:hypothetical protein